MIRRNLTDKLLDALADAPAVLVNGARQTGKSTLPQSVDEKGSSCQYLLSTILHSGSSQKRSHWIRCWSEYPGHIV
jgi:predicted AAA+ superfamily ATPase